MHSRLRRRTSSVWKHFIETDNPQRVKCSYCERECSISAGSTGNLIRHMRMKHPKVIDQGGNESFCTNSEVNYGAAPVQAVLGIECNSSTDLTKPTDEPMVSHQSLAYYIIEPMDENKSNEMDKQLLRMIVKELQPFSIVDDPGFRKLISMLNPAYTLPNHKDLKKNLLPKVYQAVMVDLKSTLMNVTAVALTTDRWISINRERYVAVIAHYFNKDCELNSSFLGCTSFPEKHSSNDIAIFLQEMTTEWGLSNKVVAAVTDNAASMVAAVKECKWQHVSCFADILNIVVKKGLEQILHLIEKIRHIFGYFKRNSAALDLLHSIQNEMDLPNLKIKTDVPTRWNTTFEMVARFSKNKEPIQLTIKQLQLSSFQFSSTDWIIIEKAIKLLIIFNSVTVETGSENTLSLSKVPYMVRFIVKHMTNILSQNNLPPEIENMATIFKVELQKYFKELESNNIIGQSVLLDPRFKKRGFPEDSFEEAYSSLCSQIISLKNEMMDEKSALNESERGRNAVKSEYFIDIWDEFKEKEPISQNNATEVAVAEISTFINDTYLPLSDNVTKYWAKAVNQSKFPTVFELAKRRLCIPATSVPGETIFTKTGNALLEKRNCLTSGKLKEILFLNHNL